MQNLFLVAGVSGSGKSEFAKTVAAQDAVIVAADDYFIDSDGNYNFDPELIGAAHRDCLARALDAMRTGVDVYVTNTFTRGLHCSPYRHAARDMGYRVFDLVVFTHGNENQHGVPQATLVAQAEQLLWRIANQMIR